MAFHKTKNVCLSCGKTYRHIKNNQICTNGCKPYAWYYDLIVPIDTTIVQHMVRCYNLGIITYYSCSGIFIDEPTRIDKPYVVMDYNEIFGDIFINEKLIQGYSGFTVELDKLSGVPCNDKVMTFRGLRSENKKSHIPFWKIFSTCLDKYEHVLMNKSVIDEDLI
jgi:hypothetical protein